MFRIILIPYTQSCVFSDARREGNRTRGYAGGMWIAVDNQRSEEMEEEDRNGVVTRRGRIN